MTRFSRFAPLLLAAAATATAGSPATSAPAEAGAEKKNWKDTARGQYEVLHLGVGKTNNDTFKALNKLGEKLGCKPSSLAWEAIRTLLKNPPSVAPAGAPGMRLGTAKGYWVCPVIGPGGRATSIRVLGVHARGQVKNGTGFFRYDAEDDKSKGRAERQAVKAAQHLGAMVGIDTSNLKAEDLKEGQNFDGKNPNPGK
jgi:hypothetical protein